MITVDVTLPVYNEEKVLAQSVEALRDFLRSGFPHQWRLVIADNASTDSTLAVAKELAQQYGDVTYIHLDEKGRGRALKKAWLESRADIVSYMDIDLSTNLRHFPPLIDALTRGYDVAIGSRLMGASRTKRSLKREILSRGYNLMVKAMFGTRFSDAQCGFKALTHKAVQALVPRVEDNKWFFDSELLILAEKKGYRIAEIPVEWVEDLDTRVKIIRTSLEDIKGLIRVRTRPIP
ncbi:MAG: glycosyltransferase family 2 protein [Dehalococcoidia bacterium]|nr:glycosyltransferase family 2 protein [Dehalococcoidia bacterium]